MSKDTGKVSIIWGESQIEKISTHPRHKKCPACVPDQNIDFSEDKPHVTGRNTQGNFTGAQTDCKLQLHLSHFKNRVKHRDQTE